MVIKRIKNLEDLKKCEDPDVNLDDKDIVNIHAILQAYYSGELEAIPRKISYWWGGVNKTGLVPSNGNLGSLGDFGQLLSAWGKEAPGGRLWIERV